MKTLQNYKENKQTELFKKTGAFFAFSQEQFSEKEVDGIKYASLGAGMICPKSNIDALLDGLNTIQKEAIKEDIKDNGAKKIIERAYFNYESQISMDTTNAMDSLEDYIKYDKEMFNKLLIANTFTKCWNLAIENDWF